MNNVKRDLISNKIGYDFKDKSLLQQALTHSSKSEKNYERLEFLGDGILDFVVGDYLFKHSTEKEGKLTVLRSHFVSENNLCKIFDKLKLADNVIPLSNGIFYYTMFRKRAQAGDFMGTGIKHGSNFSAVRFFV